ncbi:MAG: TIGR03808 family TAT-translocated repetitive protein [Parvibaculaceae bacterium]
MFSRRAILGAGAMAGMASPAAFATQVPASEFGVEPNVARDQSQALQKAVDAAAGRALFLPPGVYLAAGIEITKPLGLSGVPGLTRIVTTGGTILTVRDAPSVTLSGLVLDGAANEASSEAPPVLAGLGARDLAIEALAVRKGGGTGLDLRRCSGSIRHSSIAECGETAIFALDCSGLEIVHNHVLDIANNGIQVWQSEAREDGALVAFNRIERVAARSGGNGPYGNGINVYRAGNVTVSQNRVSDCTFSAVRAHSASNVLILANNCSRLDETGLYVEFAFEGAVVADNIVERAGNGISITNFDQGGRLAACTGNVVRDMLGARSNPSTRAIGISVEADTAVTGNVVENASHAGLWLGWGYAMRNIAATGNMVRNCGIGIAASIAEKAEHGLIANNVISGSKTAAILGMDHSEAVTGDLALPGATIPERLTVAGNLAT